MKKSKCIIPLVALLTTVTSCGSKAYSFDKYRLELDMTNDEYKIMQLTDIHISIQTDMAKTKELLRTNILEASPDLIVLTGDIFMEANTTYVDETFNFFDSFNIPFAYTYGNHDLQGVYDVNYIAKRVMDAKNSVYIDYLDDNLFGQANYYINLKKNGEVKYRLYVIDSNSYHRASYYFDYDVIHEEQLEHVKDIARNEGIVPSLAFFHIPLEEYNDAYKLYEESGFDPSIGRGENREKGNHAYCGYKETEAFEVLKSVGVKGIFVGHDHINYTDILYQDVVLSYGVKSTPEIYHDDDLIGYKLITLNSSDNSSFGLDNISTVAKSVWGG